LSRAFRDVVERPLGALALAVTTAGALLLGSAVAPVAAAAGYATVLNATVGNPLTLPDGDGFKDLTLLTVTANAGATVQPEIVDESNAKVGPDLAPLTLTDPEADGSFRGTVSLTLTAITLPAGDYTVRVSETAPGGLATTAPLRIGSGHAKNVALAASDTFYPFTDGYRDTLKVRVTATDETDTAVPFDGYVLAQSGTVSRKVRIASTTGATPYVYVSVAGMPVGTASVFSKVHGNAGPNATSATKPLTFLPTELTATTLAKSAYTIYPAVDGYGDTGSLSVTMQTSTGTTIPLTGSIKVLLNNTVVKAWSVTSSAKKTVTWNGLNGGKIVPGPYEIRVAVKGPQGVTHRVTDWVNVSKEKLVTKTLTQTVNAGKVLTEHETSGEIPGTCQTFSDGVVGCTGKDAAVHSYATTVKGTIQVPSAVRYALFASAVVTVNIDSFEGGTGWGAYWCLEEPNEYLGCLNMGDGEFEDLHGRGDSTISRFTLKRGLPEIDVRMWLAEETSVFVDYFTIEYRYKVLQ
jgi:hypothetical protein